MVQKFIAFLILSSFAIYIMAYPKKQSVDREKFVRPVLPRWVDSEQALHMAAADFSFNKIHRSQSIYKQLTRLEKLSLGSIKVKNISTGPTTMGRMVKMVTIQVPSKKKEARNTIFIVAGVHGSDWFSVAAAMYIIDQLTIHREDHLELLGKFNWWIIPLFNPDGYNLSQSCCYEGNKVRTWQKNVYQYWLPLEPFKDSDGKVVNFTIHNINHCGGVDLSNNYEYQWINYKYKHTPEEEDKLICGENFMGKMLNYQAESPPFVNLIGENNEARITLFVNIKEGGTSISYPYSYTKRKFEYADYLDKLTKDAANLVDFSSGQRSHVSPLTAGHIEDYMEAHYGIVNSITLRLNQYSKSKKLSHGSKVKERCDIAFKVVEYLALNHKNPLEDPNRRKTRSRSALAQKRSLFSFMSFTSDVGVVASAPHAALLALLAGVAMLGGV